MIPMDYMDYPIKNFSRPAYFTRLKKIFVRANLLPELTNDLEFECKQNLDPEHWRAMRIMIFVVDFTAPVSPNNNIEGASYFKG